MIHMLDRLPLMQHTRTKHTCVMCMNISVLLMTIAKNGNLSENPLFPQVLN